MKIHPVQLLILLIVAAGLSGCYEVKSHLIQTVDESWDAADLTALDLESVNGRVEVRAGSGDQVVVKAEVRSGHDTEQDIVRFTTDGTILEIRERWPRTRGFLPFSRGSGGSVRYEIEVPERLAVSLETTNGRIESHGVRGRQSISSVNGRIEIDTPDATVEATTVNGRIEASFHEMFHGASLRTVNGSVKVYVPSGTEVAADVDQVNGSFNSRLPVVVNSRGASGAPLRVTTVNGSVTLDEVSQARRD